jgi:hypothetical protein
MSSDAAKKRFKALCRDAGRQLGVSADHDRATTAATLKLMFEQLQVRLLEGERIDPGMLLKLTDAIMQIAPPVPPVVKLQIVDSVGPSETPKPAPDGVREIKSTTDVPSASAGPSDLEHLPPSETGVQIDPPKWAADGFMPAQNFHDGAPLRDGNEPWRNHVSVGNGHADPAPWHVLSPPGHPLPTPTGESK